VSKAKNDEQPWPLIILSVLVGLAVAGLGTWFVQPDSPPTFGPIECDGEVMEPGDECIVLGGPGENFTYESEQASRRATLAAWRDNPGDEIVGWSMIGLGVLGGAAGSIAGARPRGQGLGDDLALDDFGPEMERRLTADRAPTDLDAVTAGQRVQYGPLAVELTGLITPKGTISWPQVQAVELRNGAAQVWQIDSRRPQSIGVAKVPNVFVFLALVERMREATRR
jgi:hypothetical protein